MKCCVLRVSVLDVSALLSPCVCILLSLPLSTISRLTPPTQATVAGFAASSLPDGSPLRSFYLVLANAMQELARPHDHARSPQQRAALLDRWQENLAILLANRSKDGTGTTPIFETDCLIRA